MNRWLLRLMLLGVWLVLVGCYRPLYTSAPDVTNLPTTWRSDLPGIPSMPTQASMDNRVDAIDTSAHIQSKGYFLNGSWWATFKDVTLDSLINKALEINPSIQEAQARIQQARAQGAVAHSFIYPTVSVDPYVFNNNLSANRPNNISDNPLTSINRTTFALPIDVSYEIDLWGRLRQVNAAARLSYQATEADYEVARLALASELAGKYVMLRIIDQLGDVLRRTRTSRLKSLELAQSLFKGGLVTETDITQAQSELSSVDEQLDDNLRQRQLTLNALKALGGRYSPLTIPVNAHPLPLPDIPVDLPAQVLRSRPDIAAAERRVLVAGTEAGAAQAAILPRLMVTGSVGFLSQHIDKLIKGNSTTWLVGPTLSIPVFNGGRNRATVATARAYYEQILAVYRSQVLTALREVEDGMDNLHHLATQSAHQQRALVAYRRTAALVHEQYSGGLVTYLQVTSADRDVLTAERAALQLLSQRLMQTIYLVKATGGGWHP